MNADSNSLVDKVRWFTGCWEGKNSGGRVFEEVWLPPRGGTMLGMSRTVTDGRTVNYESLLLFAEEGKLIYLAHPSGQEPVRFTAVEITQTKVVFVNTEHDFPQRIIYCLQGLDRLAARIEGPGPNGIRGLDFPMTRVSCPGV